MIMCKPNRKQNWSAQRGYAMLSIIAALGIAATTVLVTTLSSTAINNEQERRTNAALALAKQALIGRAAADGNRPGSLPCPDMVTNIPDVNVPNDGIADLMAGTQCPSYVGHLPWRTLDLPDLRDASGERLWYAVSPNFRDVSGNIINSNTLGQISVTGNITASNVAAIVFAPGAQLDSPPQPRDSARQNTISSFLEQPDVEKLVFTSQAAGDSFNDRLMVIAPADIFAVVQKRVAMEVQNALNAYFNQPPVSTTITVDGTTTTTTKTSGRYPFAASASNPGCLAGGNSAACVSVQDLTTGLIPGTPEAVNDFPPYSAAATLLLGAGSADWFETNKWREVLSYTVSPECATNSPAPCASGSINITVNTTTLTNQKAALVFAGVPGSDDQRLKTTLLKGVQ